MVAQLIHFVLTRTALGQWLDGRKTQIASVVLALAAVLELLEKLATIYPQYAPLSVASEEVRTFLDSVINTLGAVGFGGLVVGVTHKVAKAKLPDA